MLLSCQVCVRGGNVDVFECIDVGESLSLREWCAWPGTGAITGML